MIKNKKVKKNGVRYIKGKKFVRDNISPYKSKENAHYECVEARRDNRWIKGMGDPFLFRIVKQKDGYYAYIHRLPPRKYKDQTPLRG